MLPLKTFREGDKITKVCVEDFYKVVNRAKEALAKAYNESIEILESIHKEYEDENGELYEGELIIGTGVSQPCDDDVFDEETGQEIAFKKAKLNANLKKRNLLVRITNKLYDSIDRIGSDIDGIEDYIVQDVRDIREYNPDFRPDLP